MSDKPKLPLKLLLLEDEKDSRDATTMLLSDLNYDVVPVSTGPEAIDAVENSDVPFYGMVMDIRINDHAMNGLQAVQRIQQSLHRTIPAVIHSAFDNPEYRAIADRYQLRISGWVDKPDVEDDMTNLLEDLARTAHRIDEEVNNIFDAFRQNRNEGLKSLRAFFAEDMSYDSMLMSYLLNRIEEDDPKHASDFIAQVNFHTFEAQAGSLLEMYTDGFVAFWRGVLVGHHQVKDQLIREVYEKKKTTDLFITKLKPDIERFPAGRPVQFRRKDGLLR